MDTITQTEARNYRGFTVTNPRRGNWQFEKDGRGDSATTYKEAMTKIDRVFEQYDRAVATLAEMKTEPTEPWNVAYYRLQRTAYTVAMDKVNTSYGINLSLTHTMATHEEQMTKAQDFLNERKNYIAEAEKALHAIQLLGIDIAEQERVHSYAESNWAYAVDTVKRLNYLAN
jgi:hypothetical protein